MPQPKVVASDSSVPTHPMHDLDRVIRVALVGVGYWGSRILRSLVASDARVEVARVCDRDPSRWEAVRQLSPHTVCTTSFEDVLDDPDIEAVLIAVPPREHVALGIDVLRANKHLFIEKPMALSVAEAERLQEVAKSCGRQLMVGLTYRYNPAVERAAELVRSGALGPVRCVYSQRSNRKTGRKHTNVLWSLAPHDVSILMHVLDGEPGAVSARQHGSDGSAGAESATLDLDFPGDVAARVFVSWLADPKTRRLVVVGERRTLVFDETEDHAPLTAYATPAATAGETDARAILEALPHMQGSPSEVLNPGGNGKDPLSTECDHFLDCVRHDRRPRTDGNLGISVTRVLAALQHSMDDGGRTVELHTHGGAKATS